jgi:hypothetical protein
MKNENFDPYNLLVQMEKERREGQLCHPRDGSNLHNESIDNWKSAGK